MATQMESLPYVGKLIEFLSEYGPAVVGCVDKTERIPGYPDMVFELKVQGLDRIKYDVTRDWSTSFPEGSDKMVKTGPHTYVGCEVKLPGHNDGKPMVLAAVYRRNGTSVDDPVRLDAWCAREKIPFP